ncbi:hypothetical protein PG993_008558 [Apiospora rasikravindrae]|uniref:Uncharacterized protein n=1 Tax=Apiospora rasikravindrae TaxID=990691 RepID=A0ABR1T135_9PEZI
MARLSGQGLTREGFSPVHNIIFTDLVALPHVWVYGADWGPPADGSTFTLAVRLFSLHVRFACNV